MSILRTAGLVGVLLLAGGIGACGEDQRAVRDCQDPPNGNAKRQIEACTQMIADRPKSALAYNNRCQAYNQLEEPAKALPDCNTAHQARAPQRVGLQQPRLGLRDPQASSTSR